MANMVLRVTPDILERKADEFRNVTREIKMYFDRVQSVAAKTKIYWQGEAGTRARESYASYQEDIAFIIRRLEEHPTDLLSMAGIYKKVEKDVAAVNAKLETNQIV